jgi:uncharacterized membrane protein
MPTIDFRGRRGGAQRRTAMNLAKPAIWALASVLAAGALDGCAAQVAASKRAAAQKAGSAEQCFGVARAGKNDCRTHAHVCAGWSRRDRDPGAFIYVPAGTCERIVGGSLAES